MALGTAFDLFARKGEARPSPFRQGQFDARYLRPRRVIHMDAPRGRRLRRRGEVDVRHFSLRLDVAHHERLRRLAEAEGVSCQKMLVRLLFRSSAWWMAPQGPAMSPWLYKFTLRLGPTAHIRLRALAAHHRISAQRVLIRLIDALAETPAVRRGDAA